jgi:hypothetical protein
MLSIGGVVSPTYVSVNNAGLVNSNLPYVSVNNFATGIVSPPSPVPLGYMLVRKITYDPLVGFGSIYVKEKIPVVNQKNVHNKHHNVVHQPVVHQPVVQPIVQPVVQPVIQPVVRSVVQPVVRSVVQPVVQPVVRSVVQQPLIVQQQVVQPPLITSEEIRKPISLNQPNYLLNPNVKAIWDKASRKN